MITLLAAPKNKMCVKAQVFLDSRGIPYVYRDIIKEHPRVDELRLWLKLSGLPISAFYNRSSFLGAIAFGERMVFMSEETRLAYIAASGKLVRSPLLVGDDFVLVGFDPQVWANKLRGIV